MEGEMKNTIMAFIIAAALLGYCHLISMRIPKGMMRLLCFLPVICVFALLPLLVSSVILRLGGGLIFAWLANFKLLLLAIGSDDKSSTPSLLTFIFITGLPVKMSQIPYEMSKKSANNLKSPLLFITQVVIWYFTVQMQVKKPYKFFTTANGRQFLFSLRMLLSIQLSFTIFGFLVKKILKCELEPQFSNPHLSTSVQNYWGRRWNRMTSSVLRSTIYIPIRSLFIPVVGRRWAKYPAILSTFAISGLLHEVLYMYGGLDSPTWDVTWYFIINGVCVAIEIGVKERAPEMVWALHPMVSWVCTIGFITVTTTWLCCTELVRAGIDAKEIEEYIALVDCVKNALPI